MKGPTWLKPLLETCFFASCPTHALVSHKSECNLFCLQCMGDGMCASCLPAHKDHHVVQVTASISSSPGSYTHCLLTYYIPLRTFFYCQTLTLINQDRGLLADSALILPRRDPSLRDPESAGHLERADIHHQQRARRVSERAAATPACQRRDQHLRGLRTQPPRLVPLLFLGMQGRVLTTSILSTSTAHTYSMLKKSSQSSILIRAKLWCRSSEASRNSTMTMTMTMT